MMANHSPSPCPLCRHEELEPQLVAETAHFLLLAASEPLAEGHLLLASRAHQPCLAALPPAVDAELLHLKQRALAMLAEACARPGLLEWGDLDSPSAHATLHAVPGAPDLLPDLGRGRAVVPVDGPEQVRAEARRWRRYVYWELGEARVMVCEAGGEALVHDCLRQALGSPAPAARQGQAAARWLRGLWQRRMAAAGEAMQVVTCLLRRGERVCLLRRSPELDSAPNKWHGVSGYLPEGVEPLEQALREIEQETGLRPGQVRLACAAPAVTLGSPALGRLWQIHPFLFDLLEGEPRLNWEHTDLAWVLPEQVARYDCVTWLAELVRMLLGQP
ncbi:MAG: NUDIX domain-containing protein [Chloroflexi bacterium]|nr:NUDIX domain-containing protein [Chloroflexota bacterium]